MNTARFPLSPARIVATVATAGKVGMLPMLVALSLLGSLACSSASSGGQTGEETAHCATTKETELGPAEKSPLGFGAAEVLALTGGPSEGALAWAKGGSTTVTVAFTPAGPARYLERAYVDEGRGAQELVQPVECTNTVAIDGTLTLVTADGAFDESLRLTLFALDAAFAQASASLALAALGGSYTVTEVDPKEYGSVVAHVDVRFAAGGPHGTITGQGAKAAANDAPDGVVSAQSFDIATF